MNENPSTTRPRGRPKGSTKDSNTASTKSFAKFEVSQTQRVMCYQLKERFNLSSIDEAYALVFRKGLSILTRTPSKFSE